MRSVGHSCKAVSLAAFGYTPFLYSTVRTYFIFPEVNLKEKDFSLVYWSIYHAVPLT